MSFFFSSRRRHTRLQGDWSSDVCSSDLIWDLVLHTAYWKCMVRRRLLRDPGIAFPRDGADWPALPDHPDNGAWKRDRDLLDEQHRLLHNAIAMLEPTELGRRGWRSKWRVKAEIY